MHETVEGEKSALLAFFQIDLMLIEGFDCLLNFAVKPGSPLEQVQQGITEVIDELGYRLASSLNEKDVQSNLDKYEVRLSRIFMGCL